MMKKQSSATNNMSVYWNLLMMMVLLGFMMFYASDSHATNHLSGLKSDIADTFGANSDVPYFLLLAEGVVGCSNLGGVRMSFWVFSGANCAHRELRTLHAHVLSGSSEN